MTILDRGVIESSKVQILLNSSSGSLILLLLEIELELDQVCNSKVEFSSLILGRIRVRLRTARENAIELEIEFELELRFCIEVWVNW